MTEKERQEFLARDLGPPQAKQPCQRCGHTHKTERADRHCFWRLSKFHWGKGMR
jgi:hypothetical protein